MRSLVFDPTPPTSTLRRQRATAQGRIRSPRRDVVDLDRAGEALASVLDQQTVDKIVVRMP
ncbi:hypothetical protein [Terrabacter sp. Root181]|uniref:hypothetical protein n=1 Tax=Terrabacter sp. Root181 TaxID=1736484 RepID=UPI0006FEE546|nr:hypothetical protein [Terrabacter sp. Root181]KRB48089.1 hypothetical protein ASD90_07370 [Terrabacter sp. Root181]